MIQESKTRRPWFRLMALPVVLSLIDMAVTLYYQPPGYWNGDRSQLIEANPLVWIALRIHPALLIPGCLGWYAIFYFLIFHTPAWVGLRCHVLWVIAHLIAIAGWLLRCNPNGIALTASLYVIAVPIAVWVFLPFRSEWSGRMPVVVPENESVVGARTLTS